jgi:putative membrane protein
MRYLRYGFLVLLALVLVSLAVANGGPVTLRLFTDEVAGWLNIQNSVTLPLYLVIFGGIIAGVVVGFIWEWFREHKQRAEAGVVRRERAQLVREVGQLRTKSGKKQDDVLALLEG